VIESRDASEQRALSDKCGNVFESVPSPRGGFPPNTKLHDSQIEIRNTTS